MLLSFHGRDNGCEEYIGQVSGSTCKKLGSWHFILTTRKKLNRLKNQQLFLDPKAREDTGQTTTLNIGETYKWIQGVTIYQSRLRSGNNHRNPCLGRKTWTVTDESLEAQYSEVRGLKFPRQLSHTIAWDLPIWAWPGLYTKHWRKISLYFWQEEEKENNFEIHQKTLFLLTMPALREKEIIRA